MAETPNDPTPTAPPSSSSSKARIPDPDPIPTTGAPAPTVAPDAAVQSEPITKKRSINDGPTGRARRSGE